MSHSLVFSSVEMAYLNKLMKQFQKAGLKNNDTGAPLIDIIKTLKSSEESNKKEQLIVDIMKILIPFFKRIQCSIFQKRKSLPQKIDLVESINMATFRYQRMSKKMALYERVIEQLGSQKYDSNKENTLFGLIYQKENLRQEQRESLGKLILKIRVLPSNIQPKKGSSLKSIQKYIRTFQSNKIKIEDIKRQYELLSKQNQQFLVGFNNSIIEICQRNIKYEQINKQKNKMNKSIDNNPSQFQMQEVYKADIQQINKRANRYMAQCQGQERLIKCIAEEQNLPEGQFKEFMKKQNLPEQISVYYYQVFMRLASLQIQMESIKIQGQRKYKEIKSKYKQHYLKQKRQKQFNQQQLEKKKAQLIILNKQIESLKSNKQRQLFHLVGSAPIRQQKKQQKSDQLKYRINYLQKQLEKKSLRLKQFQEKDILRQKQHDFLKEQLNRQIFQFNQNKNRGRQSIKSQQQSINRQQPSNNQNVRLKALLSQSQSEKSIIISDKAALQYENASLKRELQVLQFFKKTVMMNSKNTQPNSVLEVMKANEKLNRSNMDKLMNDNDELRRQLKLLKDQLQQKKNGSLDNFQTENIKLLTKIARLEQNFSKLNENYQLLKNGKNYFNQQQSPTKSSKDKGGSLTFVLSDFDSEEQKALYHNKIQPAILDKNQILLKRMDEQLLQKNKNIAALQIKILDLQNQLSRLRETSEVAQWKNRVITLNKQYEKVSTQNRELSLEIQSKKRQIIQIKMDKIQNNL